LSEEAAKAILELRFGSWDRARMEKLLSRAQEGALARSEQAELDAYERVGCLLGILQSKARVSLKNAGSSA
jgi:hypothetical protein